MPKFGIVAALEREIAPFARNCAIVERVHDGRVFKMFERGGTVLVCGGIGRDAARRATEALIALYGPETVQSVGYAGALTSAQQVGALVRPARVVDVRDGTSHDLRHGRGVLVTSATVAAMEHKRKLSEQYGADAVDMEAAAVAKGADARGIRFTALKVISDKHDFEMPPAERFVSSDGRFQSGKFALFVMLRPWLWGKLARLARNSRIATNALCDSLEEEFAARSPESVRSSGCA